MGDITSQAPTILLMVGVVALFYFMLVRPQQKRAKKQQELMEALKPGDRVMTISGIVGTVQYLGEKQAILEVSPGVEMTVVKAALSSQPVEDEFEYSDDDATEEPNDAESNDADVAESVEEKPAEDEDKKDNNK